MLQKKLLSIFLSAAMILTIFTSLPFTANAADIDTSPTGDSTVINVGSAEELSAACTTINTTGGDYTVSLTADITDGHIGITKSDAVVTIVGNGHTITLPHGFTAVYVSSGATVNLGDGNSSLTIISGSDNDSAGIVSVLSDSVCNMKSGVTLKDHKGNNYLGGGVSIEGGTFHMYGGTIENCGIDGGSVSYGGGVAVYNGGMFLMDGGTISNCYAITDHSEENALYENCYSGMGGGVFVTDGSVFTMNGGTISHNTATNFGGGVAMTLSDIETKIDPDTGEEIIDAGTGKGIIDLGNPRSKVNINRGIISGNSAKNGAGVFASGLIFAFADVFCKVPFSTGTHENPGLYIDGGAAKTVEISSNTASENGGGVYVTGIKPAQGVQLHNVRIIDNTAVKGAGVVNYKYWTQLDIDGCTISGNIAASNGGGVLAESNSDDGFTAIKNTTITGNASSDRGAGIYYDNVSEIHISGADVIQNNTFNGKQNNLNILSLKNPVIVAGDLTGSQIGLSDPTLWDDGKDDTAADAVSTKRLTDGFKTNNASLIPANVFTSDHESWIVDFGEKYDASNPGYKYTAKKYDNTLGLSEGYDINTRDNGDLFIKVPATTFSGYTENVGYLYDELCYLYGRNSKYTYVRDYELYGYLSDYPGKIFYDTIIKTYVAVFKMRTSSVYVLTSSDSNSFENFEYDNALFMVSGNVQKFLNGEENTLGLKIYYYYDESDISGLFNEYTEEELTYDEPLDFGDSDTKTVYKINENGYATTKYVISKNSEEYESSYDYTGEVRLVRVSPNYHINNADIAAEYDDNDDIFTSYVEAAGGIVTFGETLTAFYTIPTVTPTAQNSCPYIFKGWYYDKDNDNDSHPVNFGTDTFTKDIYAHWITVEDVAQDAEDANALPDGETSYGGFDLSGVQIKDRIIDTNFDYRYMPGGMRFVASLSMDVVNEINALQPDSDIEYGFVAATDKDWIAYHKAASRKLLYGSTTANGVDTVSDNAANENYFGFAKSINCTSKRANAKDGRVIQDHRNFGDYLLYTLVVTYEDAADDDYDAKVLAHPYIRYFDANGLERVAYSEYRGGSNTLGGCYVSYNEVAQ